MPRRYVYYETHSRLPTMATKRIKLLKNLILYCQYQHVLYRHNLMQSCQEYWFVLSSIVSPLVRY